MAYLYRVSFFDAHAQAGYHALGLSIPVALPFLSHVCQYGSPYSDVGIDSIHADLLAVVEQAVLLFHANFVSDHHKKPYAGSQC